MKSLKALGIIIGLMFGAGIFALPFVIYRAGIFWGSIHLMVAVFLNLFLLFLYGEITYYTEGRHRFPGYVELILGKKFKSFAFAVTIAAYYGTLLAYGLLGGLFLSNFFSNAFILSLLFFALAAALLFSKLEKIALINFYLTIPLFGFVAYLAFDALPFINLANFRDSLTFSLGGDWFLPYGVWLFSLGAFAAIAEARDIFASSPFKDFKRVILISVLLSALFYCLFVFAIVGVSGSSTSKDAFSGVLDTLGRPVILAGSLMGFLAVFTSFLALAIDLRGILRYDFGFSKKRAWALTVFPPVLFFLLGFQDFTRLIGLLGSVGIGFTGVFIIFMAKKLRQKRESLHLIKLGRITEIAAIAVILLAVVYEICRLV